jgi:hypothetical protein
MVRPTVVPSRVSRALVALAFYIFILPLRTAGAQTSGDLGALGALMVSPVGALPATATEYALGAPASALSLAYGGWRYDIDDGVHNNVGLTYWRRVGASRFSVAATGAYLSLSCPCAVWMSGGVAATAVLWTGARRSGTGSAERPGLTAHAAIRASLGGARFTGARHAGALSSAALLDLGVGFPVLGSHRLTLVVLPGMGSGRLTSADLMASGSRPLLGAAASLGLGGGFSLDFGTQRVMIADAPRQYGGGLSWRP